MPSNTNKAYEYNALDLAVIVKHLDSMIESAKSAKDSFALAKKQDRSSYAMNQHTYWTNVESGLKWAKRIAYQKAGYIHGRHPPTV